MPLPKEYYDLLEEEKRETRASGYSGLFPDLTVAPETETGGALDFLGSALWGATSGLTWGASELVAPSEPWEEMNTMEKSGWILGEGLSLFAPWGPFGRMGWLGSKATRLAANKFTKTAVSQAADKGMKLVSKDTAKQVLKLGDKSGLSDDVVKGLNRVAEDDLGIRWLKDLRSTGNAAVSAASNLQKSGANAITRAFKESKIDIDINDANRISDLFVDGLKNGNYVNDVAEWTARTLAGAAPGKVRNLTSKYLGMAANDMMMMSMHGLISGKMKALANGEDFDATGTLSHSLMFAAGFPLIRRIPWGGVANLKTGTKAYFSKYKNTNYKAIEKEHGPEVLKNLLRVMVTGEHKGMFSRSKLGEATWTAGGKVYKGIDDILGSINDMPIKHVHTLLEKMRQVTLRDQLRKWGPEYFKDLIFSIPRMGVGVVAMNPWVLKKEAWGTMEGPELGSHLFMSALMTKGRGAWGHEAQANHIADFTKYHEVLNVLNVDTKNVENVLRFHDARSNLIGMGASIATDPVGNRVIEAFDTSLAGHTIGKSAGDYNNPDYRLVLNFADLYNVGKSYGDTGHTFLEASTLDAAAVGRIAKKLNNITFDDGTTVKEIGYHASLAKLSIGTAKKGLALYKSPEGSMLQELKDELGYSIAISGDKVSANHVKSRGEGESIGDAADVNRIITRLSAIKEVTLQVDPEAPTIDQLIKRAIDEGKVKNAEEFHQRTREIVDKWTARLGNEYGNKLTVIDPVENPYFEFFERAKAVEASERFMQIVLGEAKNEGGRTDGNFVAQLDNLFMLKDNKYANSIDDYIKLVDKYIDNPVDGSKESETAQLIKDQISDLRHIFELRRTVTGTSGYGAETKGKISTDILNETALQFEILAKQMPSGWQENYYQHTRHSYLERIFQVKGMDRRAVNLTHYLISEGWAIARDGKLIMPSKKALLEQIGADSAKDKDVYDRAYTSIEKVLGNDIVEYKDFMWADVEGGHGTKQVESVEIEKIITAAKLLGNEMMSDALTTMHDTLNKIQSQDTGMRGKMKTLFTEITDLLETLNPTSTRTPITDPVDNLKKLIEEVDVISKSVSDKSTDTKGDLDGLVMDLDRAIKLIDNTTGKFRLTKQQALQGIDTTEGRTPAVHEALQSSIQDIIARIATKETNSLDALDQLMIKIQNLMSIGPAGLGLSKGEVQSQLERLTTQWHELYKAESKEGLVVLSDMVDKVNETGFFSDAMDLINGAHRHLNKAVILTNEHHEYNSVAKQAAESLSEGYQAHERHRTPVDIAREYDLLDSDGKIDANFLATLTQDPQLAFETRVKDVIYKDKSLTSDKQRKNKWQQFLSKDAFELVTMAENAQPIDKWKLNTISQEGRSSLTSVKDSPNYAHPNTLYFSNNKYKVAWLEDTVSAYIQGKLRNTSLDHFSDPNDIQKYINEALRNNASATDLINGFLQPGVKRLIPQAVKDILETTPDYLFYLRLSPQDRILMPATKDNLAKVQTNFETWYNNTLNSYGADTGLGRTFAAMVGHLKTAEISRHIVELKVLLPYLTHMGRRAEFKELIQSHANGDPKSKIAKIEANMFKRGFLTDGGTTQPLNPRAIEWAARNHGIKEVRTIANAMLQKQGIQTLLINDSIKDDINHPLNIQKISNDGLQIITDPSSTEPQLLKDIAKLQQSDLALTPSLLNSLLDGAKFASKDLMKLVMATKGRLDPSHPQFSTLNDVSSPNGAKTIIFSVGDTQLLGKGYLIYHPDIAAKMPAGVDLLIGTESAKTFDGPSMEPGFKATPYEFTPATKDWKGDLTNSTSRNQMLLPIESMGVSFTSSKAKGVNISNSMFDFQSKFTIDEAVTWMDFATKLTQVQAEYGGLHTDGGMLAAQLMHLEQASGNPLDKGDAGFMKVVFSYGAMPDNILITKGLRRMMRNQVYQTFQKSPNMHGGEDNYIVPNLNGDLSVPIHAEMYSKAQRELMTERVSANFGGIGLNFHTMSRLMGSKSSGKLPISNLTGETFLFKDNQGIDFAIHYNGKEWELDSAFYNKLGEDNIVNITNKSGVSEKINVNNMLLKPDKAHNTTVKNVKNILNEINTLTKEHILKAWEVFDLLQGNAIQRTNSQGITSTIELSRADQKTIKKHKLAMASLSTAIPALGHDKVVHRIEKILTDMDGLSELNVHDLRAIMQRDNDGDHLYTYTRLPWEIFKPFSYENGRKRDLMMFDKGREESLNPELINIFGIDKGPMGEVGADVGFHKYSNKQYNSKLFIGKIIGARSAISWLERIGLTTTEKDGLAYRKILKNLTTDDPMYGDGWKQLDKIYDTFQNALDTHSGIHKMLQTEGALEDFLFFGETPGIKLTDPVLVAHAANGGLFGRNTAFGKNKLDRLMFSTMLRTLKKANAVSNDTWDEAGSRSPEPWELQSTYRDIEAFFTNPTQYLASKTASQISYMRSKGDDASVKTADLLANQYLETFYPEAKYRTDRMKLYQDIIKGKTSHVLKELFRFEDIPLGQPRQGFKYSLAGVTLDNIIKLDGFGELNFEGVRDPKGKISDAQLQKAGFFVHNIENFVETIRMNGDDPANIGSNYDLDIGSFGTQTTNTLKKAIHKGLLRELIQRQYNQIKESVSYHRQERFTNPDKLSKLVHRLENLGSAIDIMDYQIAQGMVIEKGNKQNQIISVDRVDKQKKHFENKGLKWVGDGKKVAIYRIKGDVKVTKEDDITVADIAGPSGDKIHYGQLEFVGQYSNKQKYTREKGYTYIIDMKPKHRVPLSSNQEKYSRALWKATAPQEYTPEIFLRDPDLREEFRTYVASLQSSITFDYISTIKGVKDNRVLKGMFGIEGAKESELISRFFERWSKEVDPGSGYDPETVLLRYLLRPRLVETAYHQDHRGRDIPVYKLNEHLVKSVMDWAHNFGYRPFNKSLIQDMQKAVKGEDLSPDITSFDRSHLARYDFTQLGKLANPTISLLRHMNAGFFASPVLDYYLNKISKKTRGQVRYIDTDEGSVVPFIKHYELKNKWFEMVPDKNEGENC